MKLKAIKTRCSKCNEPHLNFEVGEKCQKCGAALVAGWLNESYEAGSEGQKQTEAKASWTCPKCLKQYLGFQRFNLCPACKTRLRFKVTEAGDTSLVACPSCHELFDLEKQPLQTGTGNIVCPKCGVSLTAKGRSVKKQGEGQTQTGKDFHVEKRGAGWTLRRDSGNLGESVREWALHYFGRLHG